MCVVVVVVVVVAVVVVVVVVAFQHLSHMFRSCHMFRNLGLLARQLAAHQPPAAG